MGVHDHWSVCHARPRTTPPSARALSASRLRVGGSNGARASAGGGRGGACGRAAAPVRLSLQGERGVCQLVAGEASAGQSLRLGVPRTAWNAGTEAPLPVGSPKNMPAMD